MIKALKRAWRWLFRSAQTGRFVSKKYAEKHPDVTTKERL